MLRLARRCKSVLVNAIHVLRTQGIKEFAKWSVAILRDRFFPQTYRRWIRRYDTLSGHGRSKLRARITQWNKRPLISVLMPLANVDSDELVGAIRSLRQQIYTNWELYVASDPSVRNELSSKILEEARTDSRIHFLSNGKVNSHKLNQVVSEVAGNYVALIAANAELSDQAFYWVAEEIRAYPDLDLIFSDEDKIGSEGQRYEPWFKPDWNPALMLSQNAFGNLGVYRRSLIDAVGGLRAGFNCNQAYDLVLRCAGATSSDRIRHIPKILYHGRDNDFIQSQSVDWDSGCRAIGEQLVRAKVQATVASLGQNSYRLQFASPVPATRVSVLIATTGEPQLLEPCVRSIMKLTSYKNFEVLILTNEQHANRLGVEFSNWLTEQPQVRLLLYSDQPFNFSWVNNWGANQAAGELLCFLNDDTSVITSDWLEQLAARVLLPGVAAAGPTLLFSDQRIQHAGVILGLGSVSIAGHACLGVPRGSYGYHGRACLEQDVSCLTAACLMIRKSVFQELGGFDEKLPITFNDVDLCLRVRKAGWRMIWIPIVELYHYESSSLGSYHTRKRLKEITAAATFMRRRWGAIFSNDPNYNPNLSLQSQFQLSFPPRHSRSKPVWPSD